MKTLKNVWWLGAIAALAACDPYSSENTGAPNILEVFATGGVEGAATTATVTDGKLVDAAAQKWEVKSPATCVMDPGGTPTGTGAYVEPDSFLVWVKVDKLLDGASIQQNASSCVPATGFIDVAQTTTAGGAPTPVTDDWYACYQPGSPSATEGSSIVFYRAESRTATTAPGDVGANGGWYSASNRDPDGFTTWLSGNAKEITTLTFTGQVKDKQGHVLPINIVYSIQPDAGAVTLGLLQPDAIYTYLKPSDPTKPTNTIPDPIIGTSGGVTGTTTAPQVHLAWEEGECNADSGATYILARKEFSETDFTQLGTFAPGVTPSFADDPPVYGKQYTYQLNESIPYTGSGTSPYVKTVSTRDVTVLIPAAKPTLTPAAGKVTVAWNKVEGASSYTVQRNSANTTTYTVPVPGSTWITVTTTSDATTLSFDDTGRTSGAKYFYRVVANAVVGKDEKGADVVGASEPSEAAFVVVP